MFSSHCTNDAQHRRYTGLKCCWEKAACGSGPPKKPVETLAEGTSDRALSHSAVALPELVVEKFVRTWKRGLAPKKVMIGGT